MNAAHHGMLSALVAAAVSGGAIYAVPTLMKPPAPIVMKAGSSKPMPQSWGELSQAEIDKLTSILAKGPKLTVSIFCADRNCDDIALDFENAFESAKWTSGIERPHLDTNVGINVGPKTVEGIALAMAIQSAVGHRFDVGVIDASLEPGRLALVISKKPR